MNNVDNAAYILSFILGTSIGSALLCAAMRYADNQNWISGRSICDNCKKVLTWDQLIPVVSFLIYRGKCKECQKEMSWFYLVFEVIAGLAILIIAARFMEFGDIWILARDLVIVLIALFALALDWYKMLVNVRLMIVGSVIVVLMPSGLSIAEMLIGACVGIAFFGVQYLLTRGKGIGSGDMFLGMFMGFALGWPYVIISIFIGYIFGSVHAVHLLATKKANRKTKLSLGMYLMIGLILALGVQILQLSIL